MRILVHDFSGHPFQMHLSRELARRGHEVLHVDCASYSTGKGDLSTHDGETNLAVRSIDLGKKFDKYSARRRFVQEYEYGRRFTKIAAEFRPDLFWGFLCGWACFLILRPASLQPPLRNQLLVVLAAGERVAGVRGDRAADLRHAGRVV